MSNTLRIAIIGCGEMGVSRGLVALALPEYEIACVVDKHAGRRRIAAAQLGATHFASYGAALEQAAFDAVFISTDPATHYDLGSDVIASGKHAFCEKPLTTAFEHSRQLAEAAGRAGVITQVGYDKRQHPTFRKVKALLDEGAVGHIRYVRASALDGECASPTSDKRVIRDLQSRPGLYGAFGVHALDLLLWYAGRVTSVVSQTVRADWSGLDDFVSALCRFESDTHGVLELGWAHHGFDRPLLSFLITGTEGTILADSDCVEIRAPGHTGDITRLTLPDLYEGVSFAWSGKNLAPEMSLFAERILREAPGGPSWAEGAAVDEVVAALDLSSERGVRVSLPLAAADG